MAEQGDLGFIRCGQHLRGKAALNSYDLPVSFKTVSEFRRERSIELEPGAITSDIDQTTEANASEISVPTHANVGSIQAALHYFDSECTQQTAEPTTFQVSDEVTQSALAQFMNQAVDMESAFEFAGQTASSVALQDAVFVQHIGSDMLPEAILLNIEQLSADELIVPDNASDANSFDRSAQDSALAAAADIMQDQAAVLKDPQECSSTACGAEKDAAGRVVKALFYGSEIVNFKYDADGFLSAFNYAGIEWKRDDHAWTAQDRQTDYIVEATISVMDNGSIKIQKDDVVRTLKASGTRIDEHKSGSKTESRKLKNKPSPYDLLAKAKAVNSIWLCSSHKKNSSSAQSCQLDLVSDINIGDSKTSSMIPKTAEIQNARPAVVNPANISCIPSAPIELRSLERSDKLRSLEDELLEPHRKEVSRLHWRLKMKECALKTSLWVTDRMAGQSSPKHLEKLDRLAALYFDQQKNDLAELAHMRALHIREQFFGKKQPELAKNIRGLASIYEARGNYIRAEQMYKEAIELQESGIRKILFLFSERVTDEAKLHEQLDQLFSCINDLNNLYVLLGKQNLCSVVFEKAQSVWDAIAEHEPAAIPALQEVADKYLKTMSSVCQ